jgi:hypothetical protein
MDHGVTWRQNPDGVIFWMTDDNGAPVRVLVTKHALHTELDKYKLPVSGFNGHEIFEQHRDRIEQAASRKFDAEGVTGELDGKPALIVVQADL